MYLDPRQSVQITQSILSFLKNHTDSFSKLIICPSFISLQEIGGIIGLGRSNKIQLGGQDVFWQENGAYTGEISAKMLRNTRCRYVIIGHSERRSLGETDQMIQKKMQAAWKARLIP
ncbi:triose-phosphate isomerase, partial [Candidatus Uhrbacteria bacterium CG_4_9_14_3_um_filter_36_7]